MTRKKFSGITSKPDFCQAIYQSFKNQQASSSAILTAGEEQNNGKQGITLFLKLSFTLYHLIHYT
jgi:hypothetical protein